jgi:hypothetical protein
MVDAVMLSKGKRMFFEPKIVEEVSEIPDLVSVFETMPAMLMLEDIIGQDLSNLPETGRNVQSLFDDRDSEANEVEWLFA